MLLVVLRFLAWSLVIVGIALGVWADFIAINDSGNPWLAFALGFAMSTIGLVLLAGERRPHNTP